MGLWGRICGKPMDGKIHLDYIKDKTEQSLSIPLQVDEFKEEHYKLLRKLDKHPVDSGFSGLLGVQININTFIPVLLKLGLIRIATCKEALETLKLDSLREILKTNGIRTGGKKEELINRIISDIDEPIIKSSKCYHDVYVHTTEGIRVIEESYTKRDDCEISFLKQVVSLITEGNLHNAYKVICDRNMRESVPRGMGVDWSKESIKGLDDELRKLFSDELERHSYDINTSLSIFSELSGESISNVARLALKAFPTENIEEETMRYVGLCLSSLRETKDYLSCGYEDVVFIASLDEMTCPICGNLDGKKINLHSGKIGIDLPPMHKGCRCTVVSIDGLQGLKSTGRISRSPITNKNEVIPYITYNQWKKKYMN